ncbi:hypothetical protein BS78_01G352900 [Paspalum vaginatum]|nr:hypothetical protein BS78_01G352900 [Paspalum vaginatum]
MQIERHPCWALAAGLANGDAPRLVGRRRAHGPAVEPADAAPDSVATTEELGEVPLVLATPHSDIFTLAALTPPSEVATTARSTTRRPDMRDTGNVSPSTVHARADRWRGRRTAPAP